MKIAVDAMGGDYAPGVCIAIWNGTALHGTAASA